MSAHFRTRGLLAASANASANAILGGLNDAFAEFRTKYHRDQGGLNDSIDAINGEIAAIKLNGVGSGQIDDAATLQASKALVNYMRTGNTEALAALSPHAGMSVDSDPDGGWTVPKQIDNVIQSQMVEMSPMRRMATIVTTGGAEYSKLINRRGATSGWVGERETRSETDSPLLGVVTPPMGELYAQPEITARLADDSMFDLAAFLQENVSDEFGTQESEAFVSGDGNNKPRGFLTMAAVATADTTRDFGKLQYVPTGVAAALSDVTHNGMDGLIDVLTALKPSYRAGPGVGWTMNSTTASVLRKMKSLGDTENYLWQTSLIAGQPDRLLGYPVFEDEYMPDIEANAYPVAFGNWRRGYTIVDRSELRLLRDPFTKKGWIRFYFTKRVGGSVTDTNAIKLLKVATS